MIVIPPETPHFSGFVFKIQANMDPKHRDRIAFARLCSGKLTRGMKVKQVRTGKTMALNARAPFFLAQAAIPHLIERAGNIVTSAVMGVIILAVAVWPLAPCGTCDRCAAGEASQCRSATSSVYGVGRDGGSFGLHCYSELQSVVWAFPVGDLGRGRCAPLRRHHETSGPTGPGRA